LELFLTFDEFLLQLLTYVVQRKQINPINPNTILGEIHYYTVRCCASTRTHNKCFHMSNEIYI